MINIIFKIIIKIMQTISINMNKEKRGVYKILKRLGIQNDGIIYGGMVRDEIIATHHKLLFNEYANKNKIQHTHKKFWDMSFHPETNKRTLIPTDMDIYFQTQELSDAFINNLNNLANRNNGIIKIDENRRNHIFYTLGHDFLHKKIKIIFHIGTTFVFSGYKLEVNIDIIINNKINIIVEPPFNNTDFTCNLFVIVKRADYLYDIRLSRNTGTSLDIMPYIQKRKFENMIINNIMNGKIEFIRNVKGYNSEYINGLRILKMLKKNAFTITNLLFEEITNEDKDFKIQDCDICLHSLSQSIDNTYIKINTNKHTANIMHKECFIQYLENEIYKKHLNTETNEIVCRCTRRNLFNFKNSYKYSSLPQIEDI